MINQYKYQPFSNHNRNRVMLIRNSTNIKLNFRYHRIMVRRIQRAQQNLRF